MKELSEYSVMELEQALKSRYQDRAMNANPIDRHIGLGSSYASMDRSCLDKPERAEPLAHAVIQENYKALEGLDKTIEELIGRLKPVTAPKPAGCNAESKDQPPSPDCELVEHLRTFRNRTNIMAAVVQRMINELQI